MKYPMLAGLKWCVPIGAALLCALALASPSGKNEVLVYPGYGTAGRFVVEGRVIEVRGDAVEKADDSGFRNLKRTLRRLFADEQDHAVVSLRLGDAKWELSADEEGFFRIEQSVRGMTSGWQLAEAATADGRAHGQGPVLMVPDENRTGIVSDVDDTILVSEVNDKSRLLANSLLNNYAQRQAIAGLAEFYARLVGGNARPDAAPIFYLSASPRQLSPGIQLFLDRNHFPRGVLITRKLTGEKQRDPLSNQFEYKTRRIEEVFERLPHVRFFLIGDDGEKDPEIYQHLRERHPQRILDIYIRKVHPSPSRPAYAGHLDLDTTLRKSISR